MKGKHVVPRFIDAHLQIEYTKLVPGELARLSVPRGTTTVLADANCIANVRNTCYRVDMDSEASQVLGERGLDFVGESRNGVFKACS